MHEPEYDRLGELAAAVADGRVLDWDAIESSVRDDEERASIQRLRAIAAIGLAHSELALSESLSESVSVRTLLQGVEDTSTPATWGSLRILERVGRGRFGDVYRAWDPNLDREVALKLLRHRIAETSSDRAVVEEGRLMARVRHPNVVTIYGAQRIDGRTGLWMEFIKGRTLEAELKDRGPFRAVEVVEVGRQLCRALAAVHDAGLVHRDVKAQNALRDSQGRVVLGDFGTGYDIEVAGILPASLAGTPAYLAPEIFDGCNATVQSDVYSLGVLLFHLCTGTYPVPGGSLSDIRAAHKERRRTLLASVRSDLPRPLVTTIERAIAATPEGRYQSALALEAALAIALPVQRLERRWSGQYGVVGVLALAISGLAWWTFAAAAWSRAGNTSAAVVAPRAPAGPRTPTGQHSASTSDSGPIPQTPSPGDSDKSTTEDSRGIANGDTPVVGETNSTRTFQRIAATFEVAANPGTLSSDGGLLSLVEFDGELAVLEIASRRKWRLTGKGSTDESRCQSEHCAAGRVWESRFSRDGSRITYLRSSLPDGLGLGTERIQPEIRSIATTGGTSRLIWRADDIPLATPGMRLFHWAGDDDLILAGKLSPSARELMVISTPSGQVAASRTAPRTIAGATLSPDGRRVAYDFVDPSSGLRDIDIWTIGTETVAPLVRNVASDRSPMWTGDGKYIVFVSSRSGTNALWAHRVENGRPVGPARLVAPDVGDVSALLGTMNSRTLMVLRTVNERDVHVADINPQTLAFVDEPRRLSSRSAGTTTSPAWSPDGQYVAYSRLEDDRLTVVVKSLPDGKEREFPQTFRGTTKLQWEPGSRSLLFRSSVNGKLGLHRFTIGTGQVTTVWQQPFTAHEVLPQPGMVLFVEPQAAGSAMVLRNLHSGEETMIRQLPARVPGMDPVASHRGDAVAYSVLTPKGLVMEVLSLIAPYQTRELMAGSPPDLTVPLAWSVDDRELIVRRNVEKGSRVTLWALDVNTGSMRLLSRPFEALSLARISPNGRHLAFEAGALVQSEVWALENALSVLSR